MREKILICLREITSPLGTTLGPSTRIAYTNATMRPMINTQISRCCWYRQGSVLRVGSMLEISIADPPR